MTSRFDRFSALIFEISRLWHQISANEMALFGLKGTYTVYLSAIYHNPDGITSAALADICRRDKADVSRAVSAMEKEGLLVRKTEKNNSYRASLVLTEVGRMAAEYVLAKGELAVEMADTGVTPKEIESFYKTLETIAGNLRCISEHGVTKDHIKLKAVLFDLDGTLLPMDQEEFMKKYMGGLCKHLVPMGYDADKLPVAIWQGVKAMYKNTGEFTNEEVFWNAFKKLYPDTSDKEIKLLDEYYETKFNEVASVATPNPDAKKAVEYIKAKGLRVTLATNPLFPRIATAKRIRWAGFKEKDFEFFTSFEDSCNAKPNPDYFRGICERMDLKPCECLLVGNDVDEDMAARDIGMKVFLITDHMINKNGKDISVYPHGNFKDLIEYIKEQA